MAYVKLTKGTKSKRLMKYLIDEDVHENKNNVTERVLAMSGQNLDLSGDYREIDGQFQSLRELSGKTQKRHQIYHVIQSFSKDEFDVQNAEDVEKVNALGLELASRVGGERSQLAVITHADNENGLLHNHIVVGGVLLNGNSLQTNNVTVSHLRRLNDDVLKNAGYEQPLELNSANELRTPNKSIAEREMLKRGEVTDTEYLQRKISGSMMYSTDLESFAQSLKEEGIELVYGKRKKQPIYKYRFLGETKAWTDRKLGEEFNKKVVDEYLAKNAVREKRALENVQAMRQLSRDMKQERDKKYREMLNREIDLSPKPKREEETKQNHDFVHPVEQGTQALDPQEVPNTKVIKKKQDEEEEEKQKIERTNNEFYDWGTDDIAPNYSRSQDLRVKKQEKQDGLEF